MWISLPRFLATRKMLQFTLTVLLFILAGCAPLPWPQPVTPAAPTPQAPSPEPACGWVWASQPLPELSATVQQTLRTSGLPQASAHAEAYGENCLDSTGAVIRFAAMQTDFYITLPAASLSDYAELGALLDAALSVLDQFPAGQTPGPQPGRLGITFQSGEGDLRLWVSQTRLAELRSSGLSGAALVEALRSP